MKNFLVGLAIGVPVGMLVGDHRESISARIRRDVRQDLRGVTDTDGERLAAAVNRVAESAREFAGRRHEREMQSATLNGVAREELLAVYGIGPVLAQRILDGRPYQRDHEVVESGIINEQTFEQLCRQVLVKHKRSA